MKKNKKTILQIPAPAPGPTLEPAQPRMFKKVTRIKNMKIKIIHEPVLVIDTLHSCWSHAFIDFVFPYELTIYISTSLWEGYPNSLITAASTGCIIACTDAGDSWKILNNQCFKLNLSLKKDIEKINFAIAEAKENNRYKRILNFKRPDIIQVPLNILDKRFLNKKLKKDNINLTKVDLNQTFYFLQLHSNVSK